MRRFICLGLLILLPVTASAEPFKFAQPISSDEDVVLAERYGVDYDPQTEDGKTARAAAAAAAPDATVSALRQDPCPAPTWTARAACANALRDKAAIANKFPWMDLVYAYDAKVLQASADADAKRIKDDELSARVKVAGDELQKAITQKVQAARALSQAQPNAQRRAVMLPPAATGCTIVDKVVTCTGE